MISPIHATVAHVTPMFSSPAVAVGPPAVVE